MNVLSQLENQEIWKNFEALNAIPRASKKEEKVIAFMKNFGKQLGLETIVDEIGNVIIKKPASPGRENVPTIILQSHLDMVHQKNNDTEFDFDTQGIQMYIDGDWVRAKGTTLGADNGLGVASIMAILESKTIAHPAIEALFTIDEETGMTGAKGLKSGYLDGTILLNLDTEEDTHLDIGCAGGIDVSAEMNYAPSPVFYSNHYKIVVIGLNGGHSGMEIHKGLGNANKIMNRILYVLQANHAIQISEIDGGGLRNAIPRESVAIISCDENFQNTFDQVVNELKNEYAVVDANLHISIEKAEKPENALPADIQERLIHTIYATHNGVYRMSASFEDLVETSNNIARVLVKEGSIRIYCLTRSSVESSKMDLAQQLTATFRLLGAEVSTSGDYPGWQPNPNSTILQVMKENYEKTFGSNPEIVACHAGLECGIIAGQYPHLDMISFGPTILGAHSPDERVSASSVNKFWKLLVNTLETI